MGKWLWKTVWELHKTLITELPWGPVVFLLVAYLRSFKIHITQRLKHKCYSRIIHGSQVDAVQMPTNGCVSNQNMGYQQDISEAIKMKEVPIISRRDLEIRLLTDNEPEQTTRCIIGSACFSKFKETEMDL